MLRFGNGVLAGDEADKLGNAFLDRVLGVLGDFAVGRKSLFHDPADVGDREVPVLLADVGARAPVASALVALAVGARRSFRHCRRNPRSAQNIIR